MHVQCLFYEGSFMVLHAMINDACSFGVQGAQYQWGLGVHALWFD